ncbi:hypothetical protein GGR52DRAFT_564255 [Hypoxylon sp. FL1284]|nr:hypothetical protein GGR52DRAFT_564255 [Hypoxylon sp. FL1284]
MYVDIPVCRTRSRPRHRRAAFTYEFFFSHSSFFFPIFILFAPLLPLGDQNMVSGLRLVIWGDATICFFFFFFFFFFFHHGVLGVLRRPDRQMIDDEPGRLRVPEGAS